MNDSPRPGAIVFARDLKKMATFYQTLLALPVLRAEPEKIILAGDSLLLVIHGIPDAVAETVTISAPPLLREKAAVRLLLPVASLADARRQAAALGGGLGPADSEWTAGNFRACDGFDPEGNIVQFRESAA